MFNLGVQHIYLPHKMHACFIAQSCPTLCDSMDYSSLGSSVHGISQARMLEWVACPSPGDLPDPGIEPLSLMPPALVGELFTSRAPWEALCIIYQSSL